MKWSIFSCLAVIATLLFPANASARATYHAFIWSANTGMQDMGSLESDPKSLFLVSLRSVSRLFSMSTFARNAFPDGPLGGNSYAQGINASGQVVGYYVSLLGQLRPFLWTPCGGIEDLGTLGGDEGVAAGINDSGQVVGWTTTTAGAAHAFPGARAAG